jgi:membrane protease subunit HflC
MNNMFGNNFPGGDNQKPEYDPRDGRGAAMMFGGLKRRLIILAILLLAIFLISQCVVVTMADEYIVTMMFGEIQSVTYEPGISFKVPFVQTVRSVPKLVQLYDIPISDVFTQDKKTMVADSFVLWRVVDPVRFIRSVNGNVASVEMYINSNTYNSMKNIISQMPQMEIITGRDTLAHKILDNIGTSLDEYGVELIAIETKHLDLPDDNKQAVYARMISERNNIAASYQAEGEEEARKIRTETDKTVSIMLSQAEAKAAQTIADGEQRYMEILAEAYNDPEKADFYGFVRALDASKASLTGGNKTLILTSDSPIAQIFNFAQ